MKKTVCFAWMCFWLLSVLLAQENSYLLDPDPQKFQNLPNVHLQTLELIRLTAKVCDSPEAQVIVKKYWESNQGGKVDFPKAMGEIQQTLTMLEKARNK